MNLRAQMALEFSGPQLAAALTESFQGYLLPLQMSALSFEARFRAEHLDPAASQLWFKADKLAGLVLIARRGWHSRIAAMGVTPAHRNQGLGKIMLSSALEAARERHDTRVTLEVFEQNPAAKHLYESLGFRSTRRLIGYSRPADPQLEPGLRQIDSLEYARAVVLEGITDLPWMLAPENVPGMRAEAFALEGRAFALAQDAPERFVLWGLMVRQSQRRRGWGRRMLRALEAHYSKAARLIQIVPENLEPEFFAKLGFTEAPLWQYEMTLELG